MIFKTLIYTFNKLGLVKRKTQLVTFRQEKTLD